MNIEQHKKGECEAKSKAIHVSRVKLNELQIFRTREKKQIIADKKIYSRFVSLEMLFLWKNQNGFRCQERCAFGDNFKFRRNLLLVDVKTFF